MAIRDITEQTKVRKGPPCTVCETLERLPAEESTALVVLLSDPTWRYTALSDALREEGVDLTPFMLSRHTKGQCAARSKLR